MERTSGTNNWLFPKTALSKPTHMRGPSHAIDLDSLRVPTVFSLFVSVNNDCNTRVVLSSRTTCGSVNATTVERREPTRVSTEHF